MQEKNPQKKEKKKLREREITSLDQLIFFFREFQLMTFSPDNVFYHQVKTPIDFWYKWRLNFRFLIQLS